MTGTALIDVDGTLGRQLRHTLEIASRKGIEHDAEYEDITEWNAPVPGSDYHIGDLIVELQTTYPEEYVLDMPVADGAREGLGALRDAGWTVVICTHRGEESHQYTAEWLEANDIPHDAYAHNVPEVKAEMGGDVLVDDYHNNIRDAAEAGMHAVLLESPYSLSEEVDEHPNVTVANGWNDVVAALNEQPS